MKNLLKLPVLLLSVMLVVSCGDSKKEEEEKKLSPVEQAEAYGVKMAELECELMIANDLEDWEKMDEIDSKIEKIRPEVEEKMKDWGEDSEEAKAAEAAFEKEMENCQEKIAEAEEKARQDRISEVTDDVKKMAEFECEMSALMEAGDMDKLQELQLEMESFVKEMEQKWSNFDDDTEMMQVVEAAYAKAVENCNS